MYFRAASLQADIIFMMACPVSDGPLLARPKSGEKGAKGTPLGIPEYYGGPNCSSFFFGLRHEDIGMILRLPRSPAPAV